jgi:hypothetical protein
MNSPKSHAHSRLQALLALLLAGCVGPGAGDEPAAVSRAVLDGTADTGDPAVIEFVALVSPTDAAICTVAVVSPHVLLTAGHCLYETAGAPYGIFLGPSNPIVDPRKLLRVATTAFDPALDDAHTELGHDLGVVVLASPLPVAPLPMNRTALGNDVVGKAARYVGYGANQGVAQTGTGIKRQATAPVAEVSRVLLRTGPGMRPICTGDSGGPMLMDLGHGEVIVGVASFSDDPNCLRSSYFQRLDTQLDWVDQQIRKYDPDAGSVVPADAGAPLLLDGGSAPPARDAGDAPPGRDATTSREVPGPDVGAPVEADAGRGPAESDAAMLPGPPGSSASGGCSYPGPKQGEAPLALALAILFAVLRRGHKIANGPGFKGAGRNDG